MKRAGDNDPSACKASRPLEWDAQPTPPLDSGGAPLPLQAPPPPPPGGPPPGGPPPPPPGGPPEGVSSGGSSDKYVSRLMHEHSREQCKVVIGSRGATISALREASGCAIKVAERTFASDQLVPGAQTQMQTITYSGTELQVQAAVRMVDELLTKGTVPARAAAAAAAGAAAAASGDEQQTTLQVHEMYGGKIIGRAGQVVKALSDRSGCVIEVATLTYP
jgi:predicted RNA-binding protein YlqC (UPF0109 family)